MPSDFKRIAVIGTGLMGGSLALALMEAPGVEEVAGYDASAATRQRARELGVCHRIADTIPDAVSDCELLFLATPIGSMPRAFGEALPALAQGAVVTDLGSAKLVLTRELEELAGEGVHYVGGHPMTGSEQSGVEWARADLYRDCYYILTPTERTDTESFRRLHGLLAIMGARVIYMDPESHDRAMAVVSHVPHLVSLLLMEMAARQKETMRNLFTIAAGGFRDMTRIAASSPELWLDICIENREYIVERLRELEGDLATLTSVLERGDRERLRELFEEAWSERRELSRKGGRELAELFEVTIPVADEPGVISRVSTAVGAIGVNIENIGIVHPLEGERGILTLTILGRDSAIAVVNELGSLGFQAGLRGA